MRGTPSLMLGVSEVCILSNHLYVQWWPITTVTDRKSEVLSPSLVAVRICLLQTILGHCFLKINLHHVRPQYCVTVDAESEIVAQNLDFAVI